MKVLLFLVLGLCFVALGLFALVATNKQSSWPEVGGTVLRSTRDVDEYDGDLLVEVSFAFILNEHRQVAKQVIKAGSEHNPAAQSRLLEKYTPNTPVTVYVNSDRPRESVVEKLSTRGWIMGAFVMAIGVVLMLEPALASWWRRR